VKLGDTVLVRCTCGQASCPAPAGRGGRQGELVELDDHVAVVWFPLSLALPFMRNNVTLPPIGEGRDG
jgi:hypothetical protein